MLARVLLALVAVVVLAWVGVLLRDYRVGHDASLRSFFATEQPAGERDRDLRRLEDAELLDPSSYWAFAQASNRLLAGDPARAARDAEALLRDEPDNLAVWGLLARATRERDPARSAAAVARIRRLDPLGSR